MKKKPLSILAIMAILLTASCSRGVRMSRELAAIDSLMDIKPDSALALLGRMDSMPMRQSDRMFLELLRGKAMNKAYVKFTSDSAMLEVARYFDRHGDTNQRMLAHYVLGCAYRDMGSAPRALEQYQQATAQADTTSSACDLSTLMRVHSQMAELYLRLRLEELEKKEDSIAKQLAWQIGDTLSALMLEEQECNYLYNAGKYSECIEKASLVHDAYLQHGFKKNALIIMIFYVKSYLALGECDKAKYYLDCMENDSMLVPASRSLLGGRGILHYYRGKYYLKVADIDSAEIAFRKALPDIDCTADIQQSCRCVWNKASIGFRAEIHRTLYRRERKALPRGNGEYNPADGSPLRLQRGAEDCQGGEQEGCQEEKDHRFPAGPLCHRFLPCRSPVVPSEKQKGGKNKKPGNGIIPHNFQQTGCREPDRKSYKGNQRDKDGPTGNPAGDRAPYGRKVPQGTDACRGTGAQRPAHTGTEQDRRVPRRGTEQGRTARSEREGKPLCAGGTSGNHQRKKRQDRGTGKDSSALKHQREGRATEGFACPCSLQTVPDLRKEAVSHKGRMGKLDQDHRGNLP